jgi:hypothetical protein
MKMALTLPSSSGGRTKNSVPAGRAPAFADSRHLVPGYIHLSPSGKLLLQTENANTVFQIIRIGL